MMPCVLNHLSFQLNQVNGKINKHKGHYDTNQMLNRLATRYWVQSRLILISTFSFFLCNQPRHKNFNLYKNVQYHLLYPHQNYILDLPGVIFFMTDFQSLVISIQNKISTCGLLHRLQSAILFGIQHLTICLNPKKVEAVLKKGFI